MSAQAIYLDYAATTPLAPAVRQEMTAMFEHFGNPASAHPYGWYAAEKVQIAREQLASAIGAKPEEIIFTSGATEANNLALFGSIALARQAHIISVATEHRAVLDPLARLEEQGCRVSRLSVDTQGHINLDALSEAIQEDTCLLSVMLANNEIGTIHPLAEIASIIKKRGIAFHTDATQALGRIPLSVANLGVDMLSLSAHKCYGPKGVGALYVKAGTKLAALIEGGGHEQGLRSGTLNTLGIVGFGVAAQLAAGVQQEDAKRLSGYAAELLQTLEEELGDVVLNGDRENRLPGLLNLSFLGVSNERLLASLQTKLAFSLASACQTGKREGSHVLSALGLASGRPSSAIRLSLGRMTSRQELEAAAQLLVESVRKLRNR